jgi:endosialidase-like protein
MKLQKLIHTLIPIVCFGCLETAQAVVPPPDGCYPGFTTAEGCKALQSLTTGAGNTAVGWYSLFLNTTGSYNTAVGAGALVLNTADNNTATGAAALLLNTTGANNTANGVEALVFNNTGEGNTATGAFALYSNTEGGFNTANGVFALHDNSTGTGHTAVGRNALAANSTGNNNTALGTFAGSGVSTANNVICIGAGIIGADVDDSCYIGNIWQQPGGSQAVYVNASGKLGAQVSSRRFKDEIKPMEQASEAIYRLKPVSFRYKAEIEPTRPLGFGLIAEDVEKVHPDLVACDKEGKPYSVRYDQVNAMLLNEFLKEHRKGEEQDRKILKQEATIAKQQKQIDALNHELKEQRTLIEKVNARFETNNAAPRLVVDKL